MKQLQTLCGECAPEMIDNHFFVCYPESPSHVTYRARLEGTSERGSDSLISLIEDWVRGGPGVIVTGVLMTVDSPSLSEGECSPHSHPTSNVNGPTRPTGSDDEGTTNSRGSSGSCYILIIAITIAITIIAYLVLKSRRGELSLKKSDRYAILLLYLYISVSSLTQM